MSISKVDHTYVETADLDAALRFWGALGFEVATSWGDAGHRACMLRREAAVVVLAENAEPCGPTVHFAVDEGEALTAALEADASVDVVLPWQATHWGTHWARVRDPDGNVWVIERSAS